jgi:hypothetical protein
MAGFEVTTNGRFWVTAEDYLYLIIRDALQKGVFERLRICHQCKAFFVANDARQRFCTEEHRNRFNNQKRVKNGSFNRYRKNQKLALIHARRLRREGKSVSDISKATKLQVSVLKRHGIVN